MSDYLSLKNLEKEENFGIRKDRKKKKERVKPTENNDVKTPIKSRFLPLYYSKLNNPDELNICAQLEKLSEKKAELYQKSNRCEMEQDDAIKNEIRKLEHFQEENVDNSKMALGESCKKL